MHAHYRASKSSGVVGITTGRDRGNTVLSVVAPWFIMSDAAGCPGLLVESKTLFRTLLTLESTLRSIGSARIVIISSCNTHGVGPAKAEQRGRPYLDVLPPPMMPQQRGRWRISHLHQTV